MIISIVICDRCNTEAIPGLDRRALQPFGWCVANGEDLCPTCSLVDWRKNLSGRP